MLEQIAFLRRATVTMVTDCKINKHECNNKRPMDLLSQHFDQIASFKLKQIFVSLKRSLCVFKLISLRCCDRFRLLNHNRFVQTTAFSRHFNPRKHKVGGGGAGVG